MAFEYQPHNVVVQSSGRTYYVDPTIGNDGNAGTLSSPFASLIKGVSVLGAGDTLLVKNGVYTPWQGSTKNLYISKQGTASNYVVIAAYPGHRPVIRVNTNNGVEIMNSAFLEFRGFEITGAGGNGLSLFGWANSFVRIVDNIVHDVSNHGIAVANADHVLVLRNKVWRVTGRSWDAGIIVTSPKDIASPKDSSGYGIVVAENEVFGNRNWAGGEGVMLSWSNGYGKETLVANNVLHNNGGRGVFANRYNRALILHNTLSGNNQEPSVAGGNGEVTLLLSDACQVFANVLDARTSAYGMASHRFGQPYISQVGNNLIHGYRTAAVLADGLTVDPANVEGDPLLDANFFKPLSPASPAVDAALAIRVAVDRDHVARPKGSAADLGAFESF